MIISGKRHLLVSVFLSSEGLKFQRYRIDALQPKKDKYFRVGRFLTGLNSLNQFNWDSVTVYLETDSSWQSIKKEIVASVNCIFPYAKVYEHRLQHVSQWKKVADSFDDEDVIFLQTNDDHALVSENFDELEQMIDCLIQNEHIDIGGVTHFPELVGMRARSRKRSKTSHGFTSIPVGYAVGTTIVKSSFFKSWWDETYFEEKELIVRPDNPLGKSVIFDSANMIIPNREIIRHMDGYSHIGLYRPLAPLRNLIIFDPADRFPYLKIQDETWSRGYWPSKIYGYSSSGVDLHIVDLKSDLNWLQNIRIIIARAQANWALRISAFSIRNISEGSSTVYVFLGSISSLFTFPIFRNLPDLLLDLPLRVICRALNKFFGLNTIPLESEVSYKGTLRTLTTLFNNKFKDLRHK